MGGIAKKFGDLFIPQDYKDALVGKKPPKDFFLSFKEIVENAGFNYNRYAVVTEDGYHLRMFRIRSDTVKAADEQAPVVFL